jgi:signal transduction histidine kinase
MDAVVDGDNVRIPNRLVPALAKIGVVAAAYVITARVGLSLDAVGGFATVVWPASGIALAALLLGGYRLWPAVWIGAFATNYLTGASIPTAAGIAIGNTLEAVAGVSLLNNVPGFRRELARVRDAIALMVLPVLFSTLIAATIGVGTLYIAGRLSTSQLTDAWRTWWLGDAIGDLIAAPFILVWITWKGRASASRLAESIALGIAIVVAGMTVFAGAPDVGSVVRGREYLIFPPLIWAALRFGTRGAVTSVLITGVIAVYYTASGRGPFAHADLHDNLLALQLFTGVTAATFLLLGASIAERTRTARELRVAREIAESANQAKANFLGVVSHELRTPLNAMMGYVELLLMQIDGALTGGQRENLERIRQSQRHLLALIEDVLGFAQVEAGRLSFALQPVCVGETFSAIQKLVERDAEKKSISLSVAAIDDSLKVVADPDKLRQVLLNLVSNAMKFTSAGGSIELNARRDGTVAIIDVRDTGIGISAENLQHVFDPFFQVDQGGTRKYPGVGLGLSIVRDAILAMNGQVGITSEPNKGTDVTIKLPLSNDAA